MSNSTTAPPIAPALPNLVPLLAALNPINAVLKVVNNPQLRDWLGFAALGLMAELARRSMFIIIPWFENLLSVRAVHTALDDSHSYILAYWISHNKWQKQTKYFTTETSYISSAARIMPWIGFEGDGEGPKGPSVLDKRKPPHARLMPPMGTSFTFVYKGWLVRFTRWDRKAKNEDVMPEDNITVQIWGGTLQMYRDLLAEAKRKFQAEDSEYIAIRMIEPGRDGGGWKQVAQRSKRRLNTVISEDGTAETVYEDMKHFLDPSTADWYHQRGIPYRRGYLLHGTPGSGKTSCILACASELDLEIYIVALATSGLTDNTLLTAMTTVPPGAVVVMEDCDVAMPTSNASLTRETGKGSFSGGGGGGPRDEGSGDHKRITLSGLMNSIDGIGGGEGRILFLTTNDKTKLDPALIRPGRADRSFEFFDASQDQARRMFMAFYACDNKNKKVSDRIAEKPKNNEDPQRLVDLASEFAAKIPHRLLSTAAIQGHLMLHKTTPEAAVDTISKLVVDIIKEKDAKALETAKEAETLARDGASGQDLANGDQKQISEKAAELASQALATIIRQKLDEDATKQGGGPGRGGKGGREMEDSDDDGSGRSSDNGESDDEHD